jgi:hypothetical protein
LFYPNLNILKIEHLIVQHLYNTKRVGIQGIGIFKLKPDIILPTEGDKDFSMPSDAFSFEYNLKTPEDEGLVNFIVQQTRKIRPLATSDLESYSILSKQFLNLGKPLVIEGVGTIQINQKGDYEFIPGQFITPKIDDIPKQLREKRDESVSFESEATPDNSKRNLIIGLTTVGVILAGLALYYFLTLKKSDGTESTEQAIAVSDTLNKATSKTDSIKITTTIKNTPDSLDSLHRTSPILKTDSSSFKIVLKEYPSQLSAQKAYARLTSYGHKVVIIKIDSLRYKLAIPFTLPLSDTLRVRDSLKVFFGGKPYVQL